MTDAAEPTVTITPLVDGPLQVSGEIAIESADGTLIQQTAKAYLCRCGASAKKPFCDGSHKRIGFADPGTGPSRD